MTTTLERADNLVHRIAVTLAYRPRLLDLWIWLTGPICDRYEHSMHTPDRPCFDCPRCRS
jgi:hypothetical protein